MRQKIKTWFWHSNTPFQLGRPELDVKHKLVQVSLEFREQRETECVEAL